MELFTTRISVTSALALKSGLSRAERGDRARAVSTIKHSADNHFLKFISFLLSLSLIFFGSNAFFRFGRKTKKWREKLLWKERRKISLEQLCPMLWIMQKSSKLKRSGSERRERAFAPFVWFNVCSVKYFTNYMKIAQKVLIHPDRIGAEAMLLPPTLDFRRERQAEGEQPTLRSGFCHSQRRPSFHIPHLNFNIIIFTLIMLTFAINKLSILILWAYLARIQWFSVSLTSLSSIFVACICSPLHLLYLHTFFDIRANSLKESFRRCDWINASGLEKWREAELLRNCSMDVKRMIPWAFCWGNVFNWIAAEIRCASRDSVHW